MTKYLISVVLCLSMAASLYPQKDRDDYKNKNLPIEKRVKDLVSKMTLEEKLLQLTQNSSGQNLNVNNIGEKLKNVPNGIGSLIYFGGIEIRNTIQKKAIEETRLGIPVLFANDVIHGLRTIYPISLAQACSWNPNLVSQACAVAAKEAKRTGLDWTFSPMIDVARDPRWGRVAEGYGEDSYTNGVFGVASVKGYQGKNLSDPYSIASCLKHFVGYGESEGGRDYRYADVSAQALWETYLPPYQACVKAGAATLMSAFNDISGVPASANHYTLTEILKNRWKHDGFVVSDWAAIAQLVNQGVAADGKEAASKAFNAGVDMDMCDRLYVKHFAPLIEENKVSIDLVNDAVSRVLRLKFRLGLFEKPYADVLPETERYLDVKDISIAQKLAEETMVLLKNTNNILPLTIPKKIAFIGPVAKNAACLLGSWKSRGKESDVETLLAGIENEFSKKAIIQYAKGCDFEGDDEKDIADAITLANNSDVIVICLGEKADWSGESASRSSIALPAIQEKLVVELKKTGKPIVLVLSNGRPLELLRLEPLVDAIVEIWQPGIAGGTPLAGILSGRINPSGKLAITFPLTTGQIPTYYNMRQSARVGNDVGNDGNYQDIPTEPLYWFGHGLSYTTYTYSPLKLSAAQLKKKDKLKVEVEVSNTGKMTGSETVHWFISDPVCSISRPIKELKYFEKKEIAAGSKTNYTFEIDPTRDLSYVDADGKRFLETGEYFVIVKNQRVKFEIIE
jgi:beta-glucosidase